MNKRYIKLLLLFVVVSTFTACSKEDDVDISNLNLKGDTWVSGPTDNWLYENFVVPYNIEVKYRFDRYELALNKVLVPPREDKVIPVMETIKQTWVAPYEQEAGDAFIKTLSPKQFVLVGSAEYNDNGTITLGTAEGGRKIVLYVVNNFDKQDESQVKQMLHTIHHEFGHILHQTVMYPQDYKTITTGYTASWNDFSLEDARSRGYITQYARSNPDDDFVEMVSIMLIEGKTGFDAIVNSTPASAQALLRQKEQIIVGYFEEAWNIDFYSLQARTQTAINAL
ncbi:putative zinc-binding metallopeptidase [Pontibacter silvestris]|uniref:Zinc-binding metallopeptidase n=1 Tax=Pontibacter silvestris TaxID=2305183 RepID=A0ABW4WV95_9BACT|nr:putative zinc-binding metallopeptidase [Pontibacter silvestris]MCC9137685.1 putative zinc-binding metallopeptidase [Pontibacter silvestris]